MQTNRGMNYDTRSLIQSNYVGEMYNNIDYDTGSNDNYFEMGESLTDTNGILEENINVQPSLIFQVEMRNIINRHAAPLGMYDELINLMNKFWMSNSCYHQFTPLMSRRVLTRQVEKMQNSYGMKPKHISVVLSDGRPATIPTFCVKNMILSLLMDKKLMNSNNIAQGYDILTGKEVQNIANNSNYGEIHTGRAWK